MFIKNEFIVNNDTQSFFLEVLFFTIEPSHFIEVSSFGVWKRFSLSRFSRRYLFEKQSKTLDTLLSIPFETMSTLVTLEKKVILSA